MADNDVRTQPVRSRFERDVRYREAFLARLNAHLATPTAEWPTVRYWANPAFQHLCRRVRNELAGHGLESDLSNKALLAWLTELGLAKEVVADGQSFHLFEVEAAAVVPDPLELLMAERPDGVICYFSAVAFHSLTTQPARHHHVAELQASAPKAEADAGEASEKPERPPTPARPATAPRLGRLLFSLDDVPYYATRRSARLVPGVQVQSYGPRANIRITDHEQTVLDMLYKPFHCGGPEVVIEACRETLNGLNWPDEEVLVEYLKRMDYPAITRRLGAMLDWIGPQMFPLGAELQTFLKDAKASIDRDSPYARISLLPGVPYTNLNEDWLVYTP